MKQTPIDTDDLEEALDYLEGLLLILRTFDAERRGAEADQLTRELTDLENHGRSGWTALRYQEGVGTGWEYVRADVEALRERLLQRYGDTVL